MFNYDAEKNIFSVGFNPDHLISEASDAIYCSMAKFFGEKALTTMDNNDYIHLYNYILDSIRIEE